MSMPNTHQHFHIKNVCSEQRESRIMDERLKKSTAAERDRTASYKALVLLYVPPFWNFSYFRAESTSRDKTSLQPRVPATGREPVPMNAV